MNDDYPMLQTDPLVRLNNQHKTGLDMLEGKSSLTFYINANRSADFIELFNRLNGQRNTWRAGVLDNIKSLPALPKQLESRFSSNQSLHIDPRYVGPDDAMGQFFNGLQTDINILAE